MEMHGNRGIHLKLSVWFRLIITNPQSMEPDYCQNPTPVYFMGGSAVMMSLFYLIMSKMKAHKNSPAVYNHGFILFLFLGLAVCARTFYATHGNPIEDIYKDILSHAKYIDKDEKNHMSALISQALHGDATESISDHVLTWSKALSGFGHTHQNKHQAWAAMKGMSQEKATDELRSRACSVLRQVHSIIEKEPGVTPQ
ncbi:uncharacterized protein LOC129585940 isoform X2 [Paramacrobiotus metropolitanus]|uniref:uncharacterized protein LOC129585940 isoform X2 n=1 Tax=Paramacrobiotus metropolitanus TaxID=2943436 RepID=UPI002445A4C5|nr:uncharacterized protein LOC129585940 isoform X2 [Paramacrobiotus metropolitanus]